MCVHAFGAGKVGTLWLVVGGGLVYCRGERIEKVRGKRGRIGTKDGERR